MRKILPLILLVGLISCTETAVIKTSTIYNLDDKIVSVKIINRPIIVGDSFSKKLCDCSVIVKLTHDQFRQDFLSLDEAVEYANSLNIKMKNYIIVEQKEEIQINTKFFRFN